MNFYLSFNFEVPGDATASASALIILAHLSDVCLQLKMLLQLSEKWKGEIESLIEKGGETWVRRFGSRAHWSRLLWTLKKCISKKN
jgi:hypothetical protein